ncbi:MAG: virulence factor MviN [Betaproteobacteria bacterium]|nr:virulence factor MviN [Betaproteobacteria bacterium]
MSIARVFSLSLLLLAASRLLGVVRDAVVASQFGLSGHVDAALVALSYPDFTISLLWGAAGPAVMVPRMAGRAPGEIADEAARWTRLALLAFALAGLASWLARDPLVHLLAPGLRGADAALGARVLGLGALLALPAGAVTMVAAAALQSQGRVQWQYAGNVAFNLALIGGLLLAARLHAFSWIAAGIALASLVRLGLLRRALVAGVGPARGGGPRWPDAAGLRAALLALAASGLTVLYTLAARALASDNGPGQLGVFHYAQRIGELPLHTVFAVAAALALARLSAAEAAGDRDGARERGRQWMRSMLRVALLLGVCGMLAAPLIVRLLFGWGRMGPDAQLELVRTMRWILALMPLQAAQLVLAARLNSHRRIADQVAGYGAGLLALALLGALLAPSWWRAPAAYAAAYAGATAVLWLRLARHGGDAEPANALLLVLGSLALGLLASLLGLWPARDAAGMLGQAALALPVLVVGGLALLRHDPVGGMLGGATGRRYTGR